MINFSLTSDCDRYFAFSINMVIPEVVIMQVLCITRRDKWKIYK